MCPPQRTQLERSQEVIRWIRFSSSDCGLMNVKTCQGLLNSMGRFDSSALWSTRYPQTSLIFPKSLSFLLRNGLLIESPTWLPVRNSNHKQIDNVLLWFQKCECRVALLCPLASHKFPNIIRSLKGNKPTWETLSHRFAGRKTTPHRLCLVHCETVLSASVESCSSLRDLPCVLQMWFESGKTPWTFLGLGKVTA